MRKTARRRDGGKQLRNALREAGLSYKQLAQRTRERVPTGTGISYQLIGFLAAEGGQSRENTRPATAELIEQCLGAERGALFEYMDLPTRADPQPDWAEL